MFDSVLVMSCLPISYMDNNLCAINRPLEIAVEGFKLGLGHSEEPVFHAFIDPGRLAPGRTFVVSDAREFKSKRRTEQQSINQTIKQSTAWLNSCKNVPNKYNFFSCFSRLLIFCWFFIVNRTTLSRGSGSQLHHERRFLQGLSRKVQAGWGLLRYLPTSTRDGGARQSNDVNSVFGRGRRRRGMGLSYMAARKG